jgi:hypothetical protein
VLRCRLGSLRETQGLCRSGCGLSIVVSAAPRQLRRVSDLSSPHRRRRAPRSSYPAHASSNVEEVPSAECPSGRVRRAPQSAAGCGEPGLNLGTRFPSHQTPWQRLVRHRGQVAEDATEANGRVADVLSFVASMRQAAHVSKLRSSHSSSDQMAPSRERSESCRAPRRRSASYRAGPAQDHGVPAEHKQVPAGIRYPKATAALGPFDRTLRELERGLGSRVGTLDDTVKKC